MGPMLPRELWELQDSEQRYQDCLDQAQDASSCIAKDPERIRSQIEQRRQVALQGFIDNNDKNTLEGVGTYVHSYQKDSNGSLLLIITPGGTISKIMVLRGQKIQHVAKGFFRILNQVGSIIGSFDALASSGAQINQVIDVKPDKERINPHIGGSVQNIGTGAKTSIGGSLYKK